MPRSKHRRKPGGKAVAHPGRDKPSEPWKPAPAQEDLKTAIRQISDRVGLSGLPLLAPLARDKKST